MTHAEENPNPLAIGVAGLGIGGSAMALFLWRNAQRKALRLRMENSRSVQAAVQNRWVSWTIDDKVVETLPIMSLRSADWAYGEILAEIQKVAPQGIADADAADMVGDVRRAFESMTGIDLSKWGFAQSNPFGTSVGAGPGTTTIVLLVAGVAAVVGINMWSDQRQGRR